MPMVAKDGSLGSISARETKESHSIGGRLDGGIRDTGHDGITFGSVETSEGT
jgi:hypothetical protein